MIGIHNMVKKILWSTILSLDSKQSQMFFKYCELVSNASMDPEEQTVAMSSIWEQAIQDEHLSDCLELVDNLVGAELSDSELDRRAYLSEYLQEEVEKLIIESDRENILIRQASMAVIENNQYLKSQEEEPENPNQDMIFEMVLTQLKGAAAEIREAAAEFVAEAAINVM